MLRIGVLRAKNGGRGPPVLSPPGRGGASGASHASHRKQSSSQPLRKGATSRSEPAYGRSRQENSGRAAKERPPAQGEDHEQASSRRNSADGSRCRQRSP